MLIRDVMSVDVIAIGEHETLIQLIAKLHKYNFHALPVVDDKNNIRGVVTPEDIMKVFLPHNPALDKLLKSTRLCNLEEDDILEMDLPKDLGTTVTVSDIMNADAIVIAEDKTIADARKLMKLYSIERIPVSKDKALVGFITIFDIIIALFKERNIIV